MLSIVLWFVVYVDVCAMDVPVHIYDLRIGMDILSMWEVLLYSVGLGCRLV